MNLEDLAKKTIDEVNSQIEQIKQAEILEMKEIQKSYEPEVVEISDSKEPKFDVLKDEGFSIQEKNGDENFKQNLNSEELFLKNIRERILVLFEGLNHTSKQDLESRLDLTLHFLEFLLASIEDKLKK